MNSFLGIDLVIFLKTIGYIGLGGILFAESGLLFGFFFPGDSLLFTAGFLASQHLLNIWILIPVSWGAAILGDSVGYAFGRRVGPRIFTKEKSVFFRKENLVWAQKFYERHGGLTIVLARFVPVVRTFAPILAGVGNMNYPTFLFYNITGGFFWAGGVTLLGFYLGRLAPGVDQYIIPVVALIILLSILPGILKIIKGRKLVF